MKSIITFVYAVAVIAISFFASSCDDSEGAEMIFLSETSLTNKSDNRVTKAQYVYDAQWNLIKIGEAIYAYDSKNRQTTKSTYYGQLDENGNPCRIWDTTFEYADEENIIGNSSRAPWKPGCPVYTGTQSYTTNYSFKNGKIVQDVQVIPSGFRDSLVYKYQNGNIVEHLHYSKLLNEPYQLKSKASYEYDTRQNPYAIKKLITNSANAAFTYSENNVIKLVYEIPLVNKWTTEYTYTYNEQGYPLTREDNDYLINYTYRIKK
jgi:hypothetical protein